MSCTLSAKTAASDLTVVVVGHASVRLPKLVEAIAARIAKGEVAAPQHIYATDGRFLLIKPEAKPWLAGGEAWRACGRDVVDCLRAHKLSTATVHAAGATAEIQALAEGCLLADYRFIRWRSGKDAKRAPIAVHLPGHAEAVAAAALVAGAQNLARDLADAPPNELHPQSFVERARAAVAGTGMAIEVVSGVKALRKAGFPGLVQVGMAGSSEPALVVIRYQPKKAKKGGAKLALVGKGLTFDSGGISIKPGDKMWEMKADMSGAAAVLGAMTAIAGMKPAVPVTGYLCLAENMCDSLAQRPGDIYRARNGKTIHVDNTDAEGRLVLADVLTYAAEQGATHIVDVATLTGACLVALGDKVAGLFSRHDDWADQVRQSAGAAGEDCWRLPMHGEYRSMLDHPHADINNIGGRYGGSITAAIFLSEFVPETVKWAHLDIAGPAIQTGGWRYYAKGMTGFSTRTLIRLACDLG